MPRPARRAPRVAPNVPRAARGPACTTHNPCSTRDASDALLCAALGLISSRALLMAACCPVPDACLHRFAISPERPRSQRPAPNSALPPPGTCACSARVVQPSVPQRNYGGRSPAAALGHPPGLRAPSSRRLRPQRPCCQPSVAPHTRVPRPQGRLPAPGAPSGPRRAFQPPPASPPAPGRGRRPSEVCCAPARRRAHFCNPRWLWPPQALAPVHVCASEKLVSNLKTVRFRGSWAGRAGSLSSQLPADLRARPQQVTAPAAGERQGGGGGGAGAVGRCGGRRLEGLAGAPSGNGRPRTSRRPMRGGHAPPPTMAWSAK
jgi:hypothetical protein